LEYRTIESESMILPVKFFYDIYFMLLIKVFEKLKEYFLFYERFPSKDKLENFYAFVFELRIWATYEL